MEEKEMKGGVISFQGYRLFSFDYKCEPSFNPQSAANGKYFYNFSYGIAELSNGNIQVNLIVNACWQSEETDAEHSPFKISVEIGGKFTTANSTKWDERWNANAIAILYPYARAIISSLTAQSGVTTVIPPTVNVAAMFTDDKKEESKD